MPYELSVDLGTTSTAAAVRGAGRPVVVGLGDRALQVPSVLFRSGSTFLVGETAERQGAAEPRVTRLTRSTVRDEYADATYSTDGSTIAFLSNEQPAQAAAGSRPRIWVVNAAGQDRRLLLTDDRQRDQRSPAWSAR